MRPSQLGDYRVPSDPQMQPDGQRSAFVVTQMDLEADKYVKQIWLTDGEEENPLTGGQSDTSPRWSPDGASIAYLSKDEEDVAQLAVIDADGGEPRMLTSFGAAVSELAWSPDGRTLAIVVSEYIDGFDGDEERTVLRGEFRHRPSVSTTSHGCTTSEHISGWSTWRAVTGVS